MKFFLAAISAILLLTSLSMSETQIFESSPEFVENKGQFGDPAKPENPLFAAKYAGKTASFYRDEFVFSRPLENGKIERLRLRFKSISSLSAPRLSKIKEARAGYVVPTGVFSNLSLGDEIVYENLYDGIDVKVYFDEAGRLEYDFVVSPEIDPSVIEFAFDAPSEIESDGGSLVIRDEIGTIEHFKPFAYQIVNGEKVEVKSRYTVSTAGYGYELGDYDKSKELIIDPIVMPLGSYFGGTSDDVINDVEVDASDNIYFCGTTRSDLDANGEWTELSGGRDAFLSKYSSDGSRIWTTYFGGSSHDYGKSLAIAGNYLVLAGETAGDDLPTNTYQEELGGELDAFVALFDLNGTFDWATYYGGSATETVGGVDILGTTIFLAGGTRSTDLDVTTYQTVKNTGSDAYLLVIGVSGFRAWATYYGGSDDDYATSVVVKSDGPVFAGRTESVDLETTKNERFLEGAYDGFIVEMSELGQFDWASYLGGSDIDEILALDVGPGGEVYAAGVTRSDDFEAEGGYQASKSFGKDAFLAKFDSNGDYLVGTYFGASNDETAHSVKVYPEGVILAGSTWSSDFYVNQFQTVLGGQYDGFFANISFNCDGVYWSSYYGGSTGDEILGVDTDEERDIIVAGTTTSSNLEVTQEPFGLSGGTDGFFAKFSFRMHENISTMPLDGSRFCAGTPIQVEYQTGLEFNLGNEFKAQLSDKHGSFSSPVDIGSLATLVDGVISAVIPEDTEYGDSYRIRVVSTDPYLVGGDNGANTSIYPKPVVDLDEGSLELCGGSLELYVSDLQGGFLTWEAEGGEIVQDFMDGTCLVRWDYGDEGTLTITKENEYECTDVATYDVTLAETYEAELTAGSTTVCGGSYETYSTASSTFQGDVKWFIDGGEILGPDDEYDVDVYWYNNLFGRISVVRINPETLCADTLSQEIKMLEIPINPVLGYESIELCENAESKYWSFPNSASTNQWVVEGGTIVGPDDGDTVKVKWDGGIENGKVTLIRTLIETGCTAERSVDINVRPAPEVDFTGGEEFCQGDVEIYETETPEGFLDQWYVENGILQSEENGNAQVEWNGYGQGLIKLKRTDLQTGCYAESELFVQISKAPDVSLKQFDDLCADDFPFDLEGGRPEGGIYSGPGVVGGRFDPSIAGVGVHEITYTYTDEDGCAGIASEEIVIEDDPEKPTIEIFGNTLKSSYSGRNTWFRSGEELETTFGSNYKPSEDGVYSVTALSDAGCVSEMSEEVNFTIGSVREAAEAGFTVYPNPAEEKFLVEYDGEKTLNVGLSLIDPNGRTRVFYDARLSPGSSRLFSIETLPPGMYVLKIETSEETYSVKIIVTR